MGSRHILALRVLIHMHGWRLSEVESLSVDVFLAKNHLCLEVNNVWHILLVRRAALSWAYHWGLFPKGDDCSSFQW